MFCIVFSRRLRVNMFQCYPHIPDRINAMSTCGHFKSSHKEAEACCYATPIISQRKPVMSFFPAANLLMYALGSLGNMSYTYDGLGIHVMNKPKQTYPTMLKRGSIYLPFSSQIDQRLSWESIWPVHCDETL